MSDRVIVITGASAGIGAALAEVVKTSARSRRSSPTSSTARARTSTRGRARSR